MKYAILLSALLLSFGVNAAEPANFAHIQYTFRDTIASDSDNPNRQGVNLSFGRNIGQGLTLDANSQFRNENGKDGNDTTRLETGLTYQYNLLKDVSLYTRGAVGYKLTDTDDFTYYAVEPGVKAQLTDALSVKAGYRYRTSFNDSIFDKTNTVRVGAEYSLDKTQSLTLGVDRAYGDSEYLGVNAGYQIKF